MYKENVTFILLNIILLGCFTLNSLYLEYLTRNENDITYYLLFYSSLCNYIVSLIFSYGETQSIYYFKNSSLLFHGQYIIISLGTFISSQMGLLALDYISMPTRILLKSCKSVPIIIIGLISGKSYHVYKIISIISISSGAYIYSYTYNNSDTIIGLQFAMISLICDGFVSVYEDILVERYKVKTFTLMRNIQMWRVIFSLGYIQDWWKFYQFINKYLITLIFLGLSGSGTQVCIFISINYYGSLSTSMMQNFRKIFTIILSCLINKYNLTSRQSFGLIISIFGILINFNYNHPLLLQKIGCKQIRYYWAAKKKEPIPK